jgi:hypothetical protein
MWLSYTDRLGGFNRVLYYLETIDGRSYEL